MPIVASDIVFRLTTKGGSAGDTTASTPAESLGGHVSTSVFAPGANSLFDDISGSENSASVVDYRAFAVLNNHASLTLQNAVVYLSAEAAGGANIAIAVDNVGPVAKGAAVQGASIAKETTAPSGVGAFSSPTTAAVGLALGNLAPGQVRFVWVKRSATNSAAAADNVEFSVSGETAA
ncbi:hypothetical protein ACIBSW_34540 [Actinoplanes sp. NPDC049668]|uniref:hypothetical protein n=1 Tax=unclassified Actinoplanes TaxID=2626549 RepID=UPI0033AE519D